MHWEVWSGAGFGFFQAHLRMVNGAALELGDLGQRAGFFERGATSFLGIALRDWVLVGRAIKNETCWLVAFSITR